jgi:hypothetical protein
MLGVRMGYEVPSCVVCIEAVALFEIEFKREDRVEDVKSSPCRSRDLNIPLFDMNPVDEAHEK